MTGLVTPNEVKDIAKARWPYTTVFDVMRPLERLRTVTAETPLSEALEIIGRDNTNQLPAVANGRLEGMISRDQILGYLTYTRRTEDVTSYRKGEMIMVKKKKKRFIDMSRVESEKSELPEEVRREFGEAAQLGSIERSQLIEKLCEHRSISLGLSGGDIDAAWENADVGEEFVSGGTLTPDQNDVEELGKAMGLIYEDGEPLHSTEKVEARDEHRWELDPASSEGFDERMRHEGEYEEK